METIYTVPIASLALLLQWLGWFCQACMNLTLWDLTWLLLWTSVFAFLSAIWTSLENDVNAFCMRHFPPSTSIVPPPDMTYLTPPPSIVLPPDMTDFLPPPSIVLPPNMTAISDDDINSLNLLADAIQRRINFLRTTKVNFVRSRTWIPFRVGACSKLQKQLAQAQRALADERSNHEATEEFLQHQSNARADGEEVIEQLRAEVEDLKAQLAEKESGLGEDAQTEEAEETKEESPEADEINSPPITPQPEDTVPPPQIADESAETIARLRKELEDLQAEREELEDQRDTWREAFEEEELKVEELAGEKEDNERRIGDLESQLGAEKTSREEAQAPIGGLRDENEKLRQELQESKAQHESLRTSYQEEERANEEKAAELTSLRAEYNRLQAEVTSSRPGATSSLDGSAAVFVPAASPSSSLDESASPSLNGSASEFVPSLSHNNPFPDSIIPEPTPAPSATGPGQARNPHIQKLNEEVKRREWREKSGMAGSAEEEEGNAGPEDVLDDMYDRQVTQPLTWPPARYARGSMFGAFNDVPSPAQSVSTSSTSSHQSRDSHHSGGEGEVGTGMPMLGNYEVTRGNPSAEEEQVAKADKGLVGTAAGESEQPKAEEEKDSRAESRPSPSPPLPAAQDVPLPVVTRPRLPSNYWAQSDNQEKTHDEEVGDALADYLAELNRVEKLPTLKDSIWAPKKPAAVEEEEAPTPATEAPIVQPSSSSQAPSSFPSTNQQAPHFTQAVGTDGRPSPSPSSSSSPFPYNQRGRGRGHRGASSNQTPRSPLSLPRHLMPAAGAGNGTQSHQRGGGRGRGRGGQARGSGANESFRRLQEHLAREKAEKGGM